MEEMEMEDEMYKPVSDEYGNELCVNASDYPDLAKMPRGTECEFKVRGAIKCTRKGSVIGGKEKLEIFIWDAQLCEYDKESKPDVEDKIRKALMGSGRQVNSQIQDTFTKVDGE